MTLTFIHNEVIHNERPPLMEASKRFLMSYLDSLIGLKIDLITDQNKVKQIVTYDKSLALLEESLLAALEIPIAVALGPALLLTCYN